MNAAEFYALGVESWDIKQRQNSLMPLFSWCLHLTSGVSFAGASSSPGEALESMARYAEIMQR